MNQNLQRQEELLRPFLNNYNFDKPRDRSEFEELKQAVTFLIHFDHSWSIATVREEPDFVITNGKKSVALEHTAVRNPKLASEEGSIIDAFYRAEKKLRDELVNHNFLASIHLNKDFKYKKNKSDEVIQHICDVVKSFVLSESIIDSQLISRMSTMDHYRLTLSPNFGAWWQASITPELITEHVNKKEKLFEKYKANTQLEQWLLLVIGHHNKSSYATLKDLNLNLKTNFNRIFLLELSALTAYEIETDANKH